METDHRVVTQGNKKVLQGRGEVTLEAHIADADGWAELSFSKQGLANKPSSKNSYVQGSNLYFWYPRENAVAGFCANSDGALLDCNRDPSFANSSLGVFACASEGSTNEKILGGSLK